MAAGVAVTPETLEELQKHPSHIRNVCVLAHVDHGKTTLSDHLIASNGLIHPRLAGELRFMDSREEEQARGITMKSSSISLTFTRKTEKEQEKEKGKGKSDLASKDHASSACSAPSSPSLPYLINLIDSPGHVDFCSEVSTATRLCDGAIVVVDAVEGVCSQTVAVLRAAWEERVQCVLMLNKIDRLVVELGMSAQEAHQRLQAVVAHANMVVSGFASERYMAQADAAYVAEDGRKDEHEGEEEETGEDEERDGANANGGDAHGRRGGAAASAPEAVGDPDADLPAFDPLVGSVVFGSAGDGWAFSLADVARRAAGKLGAKPETLVKFLWGDYAFDPKTKRVVRTKGSSSSFSSSSSSSRPTLFASLALEPVWKLYESLATYQYRAGECGPSGAEAKAAAEACVGLCRRAAAALGLELPARALRDADPKGAVRALLRAWMPAADAVLEAVCAKLPSPSEAAPARAERLLPEWEAAGEGGRPAVKDQAALAAEWGDAAPAVWAIETCAIHANRNDAGESGNGNGNGNGKEEEEEEEEEEQNRPRGDAAAVLSSSSSPSSPPRSHPSPSPPVPPTVIFVSKMVSVPLSEVPGTFLDEQKALSGEATARRPRHFLGGGGYRPLPSEAADAAADEVFLAFGRVFAGTVRDGQEVYVLPHDWDPRANRKEAGQHGDGGNDQAPPESSEDAAETGQPRKTSATLGTTSSDTHSDCHRPIKARIHGVYLMMGRGMAALPEARAGAVVALGGLGGSVLKSATLASTPRCPALCSLRFQSEPIVRVAVAPEDAADYPRLLRGLELLVRADPLARVLETEAGEHLLCVAGEVHLEICLKDLRERFARCGIVASEPLAALRESIAQVGLPVPRALPSAGGAAAPSAAAAAATAATAGSSAPGASAAQASSSASSLAPASQTSSAQTSSSSTWMTAATAPPTASQTSVTASSSLPPESLPPPKVAEAATPDGSVRVRARAWALPAALATLLEKSEDALADALERERTESGGDRGEEAQANGAQANAAETSAPPEANALASASATAAAGSARRQVAVSAPLRELHSALAKQVSARGGRRERALRDLLARAWALGPRGRGPNLLLADRAGAGSLFDAPPELVVRVTRQSVANMVAAPKAASAQGEAEGVGASLDGGLDECASGGAAATAGSTAAGAADAPGGRALHPSIVAALRALEDRRHEESEAGGEAEAEAGASGSGAFATPEHLATPGLASSVAALTAALASLEVRQNDDEATREEGNVTGGQNALSSDRLEKSGSASERPAPAPAVPRADAATLAQLREALTRGTLTARIVLGTPLAAHALGFAATQTVDAANATDEGDLAGNATNDAAAVGEAVSGDAAAPLAVSPVAAAFGPCISVDRPSLVSASSRSLLSSSVLSGFSLASASGPLCAEPLWGVAFEVELAVALGPDDVQAAVQTALAAWEEARRTGSSTTSGRGPSSLPSLLLSALRARVSARVESCGALLSPTAALAFRGSVLAASPRVVEPHLLAEVSVPAESLSAVYAVLGRRKARVVSEEAREGSGLFAVRAHVPAERAFGFASELRVRASGGASATLALSHWKRVEEDDPFFVPRTEAEREEFGEEGQGVGAASRARRLIDAARERKGLVVSRKVVESATKQRTLARKV